MAQPNDAHAPHDEHPQNGQQAGDGTLSASPPDALENIPTADLIHRLCDGEVQVEQLTPALRQRCVEHLTLGGYSNSDIAALLKISERTVTRDRTAIRRDGALSTTPELGNELLGEYQRLTLASIQRLTRLASDSATPPYARLWAEDAVTRVYQRFMETARRLGYLERPRRPLFNPLDPAAAEQQSNLLRSIFGGEP